MKIANDIQSIVIAAGFGAAVFVANFVVGQIILLSTGIPLIGGFASVIPLIFVCVIGAKLVPKLGTFTIMWVVATALSFPTTSFGPPGLYKIAVGLALGVIGDFIVFIFQYKKTGYIIACASIEGLGLLGLFYAMILLGFPIPPKLPQLVHIIAISYAILAAIGAYLGLLFFEKKLKNLTKIKAFIKKDV